MPRGGSDEREALHERLWDRLGPLRGERAVLTAVYGRSGSQVHLRYASLLVGPAAMARSSWSDWKRHHDAPEAGLLPAGAPATFIYDGGDWLAGRADLPISAARQWLREALLTGRVPAAGTLPAAHATLEMPSSPLQARYPNRTTASGYVINTVRPVTGYFFVGLDDPPVRLPRWWPSGDRRVVVPPTSAIGIDVTTDADDERVEPPAAPGLLLGRLSRSAWINSVRYEPDSELFTVGLRLEPRRIDIYGLTVEVREHVRGELALAARTALADIRLPSRVRGRLWIRLPTLGRGLQRELSLYDRDGTLLDHFDPFALVESIHMSLQVNGGDTSFTVGERRAPPAIDERLASFERVEQQYRELLERGMPRRVVQARSEAVNYLRERLARARSEIRIMDPYFGSEPSDWDVLARVTKRVRILRDSRQVAAPAALRNVQIRRFVAQGKSVPFHDRIYLWEDTGLSVGTSPNGFGNRVFRIDELPRLESETWRALFDRWWASADFKR